MKWLERRIAKRRDMPDFSMQVYCEECVWWEGKDRNVAHGRFECRCPDRASFPWRERRTSIGDSCYVGERYLLMSRDV